MKISFLPLRKALRAAVFFLLFALFCPFVGWSQDYSSLTVNDDASFGAYSAVVPFNGQFNIDHPTYSQFIIPAADLTEMQFGYIQYITFYLQKDSWGYTPMPEWAYYDLFRVYVVEVDQEVFEPLFNQENYSYYYELYDWNRMEMVYDGYVEVTELDSDYAVKFPIEYYTTYEGGNLLVGIQPYQYGHFYNCSWMGKYIDQEGGYKDGEGYPSIYSYYEEWNEEEVVYGESFLPMMTFDYYSWGGTPSCLRPRNLQADELSAHSVTLSWTPLSGESQWEIAFTTDMDPYVYPEYTTIDSNPYVLTGLDSETTYKVYLRAHCDEGYYYSSSESTSIIITTTTPDMPIDLVALDCDTPEGTVATLHWDYGDGSDTPASWDIAYTQNMQAAPDEVDFITVVDCEGSIWCSAFSYQLTSLTSFANYKAWVRADYGNGDVGEWSEPCVFKPTNLEYKTVNGCTSYPYSYTVPFRTTGGNSRSQFIIPASDLTDLVNHDLWRILFYYDHWTFPNNTVDVYLAEEEEEEFTVAEYYDWNDMERVVHQGSIVTKEYSGCSTLGALDFDVPYHYQGGNLLVGVVAQVSYNSSYRSFYGCTTIRNATLESAGTNDPTMSTFAPHTWLYYAPESESQYLISVVADPETGGSVSGGGMYGAMSDCVLYASPNTGFDFEKWTKDGVTVSTEPTYSFVVTEPATYTAHFTLKSYEVSAMVDPEQGGEVTGVGVYYHNDTCTLTATANTGYSFSYWSKGDEWVSSEAEYSFPVTEAVVYTAHFVINSYQVTVVCDPVEGGTVTGGETYNYHTTCHLVATAKQGYTFSCWIKNGIEVSSSYYYDFVVTGDVTITAKFNRRSYQINASAYPSGGGIVNGGGSYLYNDTCTLTAVANPGYSFLNWTKGSSVVSTDSIYRFVVSQTASYVAKFDSHYYDVSAIADPAEGGSVSGGGAFLYGDTCTLTAVANAGYVFHHWSLEGTLVSTDATYCFVVEGDVCLTAHFSLPLPELPDLHVTGITHSSFIAGQQVSISWTVQNDGTAPTPNGAVWHDRVWLSLENRVAAWDNDPILLGTFDNLSALNVGEYYTQNQTFTLPLSLSGPYYLFVISDAYDCTQIYWGDEEAPLPYLPPPYFTAFASHCQGCGNLADNQVPELSDYNEEGEPSDNYHDNFFYTMVDIAVPPLPDLQVVSIIAPDNFFSGSTVEVTATISNLGEDHIEGGSWSDALYVAMEPDFDKAMCIATTSHFGPLAMGESYLVSFHGTVPLSYYGECYFFVKTNVDDQVYEHVLNSNNVLMSDPVNVILTPPADLVPSDLMVPSALSTASPFTIGFKVTNAGLGAPNNDGWMDLVYLSQNADSISDDAFMLYNKHHSGGLAAGTDYSCQNTRLLPPDIAPGTYYLYVLVDAENAVFEYVNEGNNLLRSPAITVARPDLLVTECSAPQQLTAGYPMNLTYTLSNVSEATVNNRVVNRYCVSPMGENHWVEIACSSHDANLAAGESMTVVCNETAAANLQDGIYALRIEVDFYHEIPESNEDNNVYILSPIEISHQPLPDLVPLSLSLPSVIQAGETIGVEFDITNQGDLELLNSNCSFDVYALQGQELVLCPVQTQTLPLGSHVSIGIQETVHFVRTITVPPTVTSSCTAFRLVVDKKNLLEESDETNNSLSVGVSVLDCPLPDLVVASVETTDMQAGLESTVSFSVMNQGAVDFAGSFGVRVYAVNDTTRILLPLVEQVQPALAEYTIAPGASLPFVLKVMVSPEVGASYQHLEVVVDEADEVLESNENNNGTLVAASFQNYPFDLKMTALQVPATLLAGEHTSISWTVKNIGSCPSSTMPMYMALKDGFVAVEGEVMPTPWLDRVFVSEDAVWDDADKELSSVSRQQVLAANGSYTQEQSVTIPYSALGARYLICVNDATTVTYDSNRSNNVKVVPVTVELGQLPNLVMTAMEVDPVLYAGRSYVVRYTVMNQGERATQCDRWVDAFYLNAEESLAEAVQLTSKLHQGVLEPGEQYQDSVSFILPNGTGGGFFFTGCTDATGLVYEHDQEDDNRMTTPVVVTIPDPCDLMPAQPDFPSNVLCGEEVLVSWWLSNTGANPAIGRVRNAVYLSTDPTWSSDDVMLGYNDVDIDIPVNGTMSCTLDGVLNGVDEGRYYIIVKANILNALNEFSFENNISVSLLATEIGFPTLAIGEAVDRTMAADEYIYYKVPVDPAYEGQTLSCALTTADQHVANAIYVSNGAVPSPSSFQYSNMDPYTQTNEVLIPSLEGGAYYLLVRGSAYGGSPQQVHIALSIISFEILYVDADHGANTGSITTKVTGAKFDSIMDFRLVQGGDYVPAEKLFFSNSTETFATFDLVDMSPGVYAMEAELPGGIITIKGDAFTIEEGLPAELAVNIVAPSSVRQGNTFPVNIEFGNIGTTDLNVSALLVVSRNGHPIALTTDELSENLQELSFPTMEANGNPDVLRPGYKSTKTVFVKATQNQDVNLQVFAIRKQY